jgi:hypothetical protein
MIAVVYLFNCADYDSPTPPSKSKRWVFDGIKESITSEDLDAGSGRRPA